MNFPSIGWHRLYELRFITQLYILWFYICLPYSLFHVKALEKHTKVFLWWLCQGILFLDKLLRGIQTRLCSVIDHWRNIHLTMQQSSSLCFLLVGGSSPRGGGSSVAAKVPSADEKSRWLLQDVTCETLPGASGVIFRHSKKKLNLSRAEGGDRRELQ